eukprot:CAMPEP_0185829316 /NCGR_PEP_ID=MMETSP1353-20130828/173_1 /TAXON_ID=1077150 /ORGANISM="Erythrolobus australicus, Strain CCMP3124" /LENGTH=160 /DNA_ID=CAMNT_0028527085 /DNA_START=570 /DNA_END=1049 /DNA_ORIENTATION=-
MEQHDLVLEENRVAVCDPNLRVQAFDYRHFLFVLRLLLLSPLSLIWHLRSLHQILRLHPASRAACRDCNSSSSFSSFMSPSNPALIHLPLRFAPHSLAIPPFLPSARHLKPYLPRSPKCHRGSSSVRSPRSSPVPRSARHAHPRFLPRSRKILPTTTTTA